MMGEIERGEEGGVKWNITDRGEVEEEGVDL